MKKERLVKGTIAVLAAAGLLFSGFRMAEVDAAVGIETGKADCSITIQVQGNLNFDGTNLPDAAVSGNDLPTQAETDLQSPAAPITVNLYRVAEIGTKDADGYSFTYKALNPFNGSDEFKNALAGLDDETSAADWRNYSKLAAQLAGIVSADSTDEDAVEVDLTKGIEATETEVMENGTATIEGLQTGLYLVAASKTYDSAYEREYSFAPYLISLPDNRWYDVSGTDVADGAPARDAWNYNITVGLKPQITRLLGDLQINKTLSERNPVEGTQGASSVFHVVVTDSTTGGTKEIYNNMVSFRLGKTDAADDMSGSITIGKFPAGAVATVTEVYAGAGYQAAGELTASVPIVSDKAQEKGSTVATVSFTNKSDGTLKGGYGIVNHFTEDANTTEQVQKESNSADGVENKTAYKEAER